MGTGITVPCVNKKTSVSICRTKEMQLTYWSGYTSKLHVAFFFFLLGTFCSYWWLKGGSFHIEVQQEVFKLDKRKDYLAERLSVELSSQGDYGI